MLRKILYKKGEDAMLELNDFYTYQEDGKTYLVIDENNEDLAKSNTNEMEKETFINMLKDLESNPNMVLEIDDLKTLDKTDIERYGGVRFVCDSLVSYNGEDQYIYMKQFRMLNDVAKAFIKIVLYYDFGVEV
jgi:hypothetical protein